MSARRIPDRIVLVPIGDVLARVRYCGGGRAATIEQALADEFAVGVRIGPMSLYANVEQAEALGHALLAIATHVREYAATQMVTQ